MKHLPISFYVARRRCLVVGGGEVAARKIDLLLKRAAQVIVVAPDICPAITVLRDSGKLRHETRTFKDEDLSGVDLIFAATDDRTLNKRIAELAQARRLPVNVIDDPELCTFIMPSIIERDPVQVAVSSGGASPVLARLLRARLESFIPATYGRLAALMGASRKRVRKRLPDMTQRRRFWEDILHGPIAEMLFAGREQAALQALEQTIADPMLHPPAHGEVYLVGGGPGDPDLLTFRALRLMQQADVVIYDRLVAPEIVALARKDAERIYVGKERDQHTVPQPEINALLVQLAKAGKRVLRLKGGDPFIFGRGGEEIETLSGEGIPFQVVPGITAAAGCASYAGIPLTHRDYAQSCVFVTGHLKNDKMNLNWPALVQPQQTLAVYMSVHGLDVLCRGLIGHGMCAGMPAALVERGTLPRQRVLVGSLESLPALAKASDVQPPSMVIIGEVVKLHDKLKWFSG
ncbi:MAG TPA: siroheme synthase CysG [Gammaproteobacteria bacterium]|nr:siroheme synthase CysG [Gammaproteobacteria bacterium]